MSRPADPEAIRALAARLNVLGPRSDPEMSALVDQVVEQLRLLQSRNSELEKAKELLSAEERRYRALFDHAPDGYLVTDDAGLILEANQGIASMLGRPVLRLLRKPLVMFAFSDDRPMVRAAIGHIPSAPAPAKFDLRLLSADGPPVYVRATLSRLELDEPQLQWLFHDVTDLRRAEWEVRTLNDQLEHRVTARTAELEAANLRLDVLVEQLPVGVVVADRGGRITILNTAAQELMREAGLEPELPEAYLDLRLRRADGSFYSRSDRPLTRALERGESTDIEVVELELQDGTVRHLEIGARPLRDPSGDVAGAVAVVADVSARENRERGEREFVANAAHQLRNPLAAIRSAIEVLQAGAKDHPDIRDRFLGHIERESERLARLARTLLVLARAQSAVEDPRREIVEVARLLQDVAGRVEPAEGVEIAVSCDPGTAAVGNPELLEEALLCLADNAVRHAGDSRVVMSAQAANGSLLLEVKDEGRGIPAEVQERLFDRFHQAGRDGFGLGLAIAAQATKASGGRLEIDSGPGRGTAARITLPVARLLTP